MLKHLQKLLLIAALCLPWVTQAQVTCDSGVPDTVTNLPNGTTASSTTSYFPGYATYNYSYNEVIIPSSQLEDGGITEIKALMFKPENTTSSTYYTNCTIYLANTTVANLSSGFIQSTADFEVVFTGSLNFTNTNWQTVEFDNEFTWDGSSNIVVAVKRDHGSWSSSTSFKAFSASSSLARYIYQDSGPYTVGSISGGTATSTVPYYKLVGCSGDPVSCNRVRNLAASDILPNSVTLTWLDTATTNTGATYTVYDMADTSVLATGLNTNTYTITGLNANTVYTFAVVADCGGGDVSNYAKLSVRTACASLTQLPFTYGFEDAVTGTSAAFPSCWTRINDATGTYNYYPYVYASAAHSGTKGLYWYMSTSTDYASNEYLVLPPVDPTVFDVADLTLSFWAGATSATYHPVFVVGVMSDPEDVTTFVPVDTISGIVNVWTPYAVNFEDYTGSGTYVAIKAFRPTSAWYAYMDDITLIESSDFCAPPTHVTATTTTTSIDLSWNGEASDSYLIYHLDYDTLMVSGTTANYSNLIPNTSHEFLIAHICNDTSDFVYFQTRTDCAPIDTLPYIMNFNNDVMTGSSYLFDPCWNIYNNYSTAHYPYVSSGYLYMYLYSSSQAINTMYGYAMLPELDESLATTDMELSFKAWNSSTSSYGAGVIVAVFDSVVTGMPTFDTIAVIIPSATSQSAAETYYVTIADRDLTGKRIGFFYQNQRPNISAYYYYCYIDDVNLHEAPSCFIPSNLMVNAANADSVIVSWADSNAYSWEIALGSAGFNPDTLSEYVSVSETSYALEELTGGVTYEVYVRADCGGDQSLWLGPVAFTPGAINMGVSGSATMYVCNAAIYDNGGANGQYENSSDYILTLYPNDTTKRFKFWGGGSTESCCDYLRIYAGAAATGTVLAQIVGDNIVIDTVITQGGPVTLQFHSDGSVVRDGYVIYFACEDLPSCRDIADVEVNAVSTSSAYVTWTNAIGTTPLPTNYIVTVYDSTNSVAATVTTPDMFAIVSGLDPNYGYSVTVVPACDEGNGMPSGTTFSTAGFSCIEVDSTSSHLDTIGSGTSTDSYFPVYTCYNYCLTQQIYTASEFNGGGAVTGIAFMPQSVVSPNGTTRTIEIYLAHVSSTSPSDFVYPTDLTMVYNGSQTFVANQWSNIVFDNAFNYNGTDNLLVMFRDMTGVYSCSNSWYVHTASTTSHYIYQDSGPYTVGSTTGGYSSSNRMNAIFSFISCSELATCAAPLFVITGKTGTTVDLMWAPGASESSWTVEHRAVGVDTWTTDFASTTQTSATISGLTPNVEYEFRVFHVCSTDTFATVRTVRTDCVGESIPFSENFSTWATGSASPAPSCWFKLSNYSSGYPYVNTSYSMGDGKSMYFYASGTTHTCLILPKMDAPIDTLLVSGFVYYSSAGYQMNVGVITDVEDYTTFHPVGSVSTVAYQWTPFEFVLAGQPEGNIAFSVGDGGSYAYLYLDNIEVNYMNPCVRPTNVNVTNITLTTADVSWTDTAATNFIVEYGPSGFTHGMGTQIAVTGNSVQLTNLTHSIMYDVYVCGLCSNGDTSNWSFARQFATACGTIDALPLVETFDTWGSGTNVHAPNCWGYGSDYSTTYPYISTTAHNNSAGSMYMYDGSSAGSTNKTWFRLPELDPSVASANQTQVIFWTYCSTSSYSHPVMVGVGKNATIDATVVWIDTVYPTYGQWTEHEIALDSYTDTGRYIYFSTNVGGSYAYSYPYIDDLTLEMIPTCQRPNNLSASNATYSSVDLSWNDRANASQWQIEYGPIGFTPGTGTMAIANSNPYTLAGLPSSYQGEFYVRAICSATDSGVFSRESCVFNTTQAPATLPYNYDFEDPAEWANWQTSCNSADYNWYRGTDVADSGSYSMYVASSDSTYYSYSFNAIVNAAAYRDVDFGPIDSSYTFSFRARAGGTTTNYYDGLMVFLVDPAVSTVPSNSGITSPWGNVNDLYRIATMRLDTTWQTYTASFDTIHGVKRVAFFWFNQNTGASYTNIPQSAAVDNIHIDYASCPRPVATTVNTLSSTTASLSWTGPSVGNYQVIYRQYPGSYPNTFLQTNTNSIMLTGLDPLTQYAVWVRKFCGNDTSMTSDGITFTTEMCDGSITATNFVDSLQTTSTSSYSPIGYAFYNYSYVQTIIDSANMEALRDAEIIAFAFDAANTTSSDYYTNMDVYMANVSQSDLSSGFIMYDTSFVKVVDNGNFNFDAVGQHLFGFDTSFVWDGHSNVLFAVNRKHGSYSSSGSFNAHNASSSKMRYVYNDGSAYDPSTVSGGTASTAVGDIYLISCGGTLCRMPSALSTNNVTYNSATLNWAGTVTDYEVAVKAATDATWPEEVAVSNSSYAVTGLQPATTYQFRVRAICDADEQLISDWAMGTFVTDSLPCFAPSDLQATASYTSATFNWTVNGEENMWNLHVWNTDFDSVYTVNSNPATVGGLVHAMTYNATVSALCGGGVVESDASDTIEFTTASCTETVSNVQATNVTAHTATITWSGNVNNYIIRYDGGEDINVTGTTYTYTGLQADYPYTVYVRAACAPGVNGDWSAPVNFTTQPETQGIVNAEGMQVTVYPNPTSSATTIALSGVNGEVRVSIVDMNGRTVMSEVMECEGDCAKTIEVSDLAQGAYFVRVNGENVNMVKKLVVK